MNDSQSNRAKGEERTMIQYWLGELSPEAEQRLEDRYFAEDELFEQLLAVREELFDAFARGELSETQRGRFEQHLLQSSEDRDELEFARRFVGALDAEISATTRAAAASAQPATPRSWWSLPRLARAIVCAALLVTVGWLVSDQLRSRSRLARLQSEQPPQPTPQPFSTPSPNPSPPSPIAPREKQLPPANTLAVTLSAVSLRSAGGDAVQLTPETRTLRFKLLLDAPDAFRHYQVVLTQGGRKIRSWRRLKPARSDGVAVVVELLVTQLSSGEYSFELRGVNDDGAIESAGRYSFRIAKP
jgi:hypothetical protein